MSELTNWNKLGFEDGVWKRQGLKQGVSDGGEIQFCSTEQYEKDAFLSIKACEPILAVTQNESMNLKMSIIWLL